MTRPARLMLVVLGLLAMTTHATEPSAEPAWPPESVAVDARVPQRVRLRPAEADAGSTIAWHPAWPHIVGMRQANARDQVSMKADPSITLGFNKDATEITLAISKIAPDRIVVVDTSDKTTQFADGTWAFVASDAKVHGSRAALEAHRGSFRIGYWTNPDDFVTWDYTATRWGTYDVAITYSLAGGKGSDITVSIGDAQVTGRIEPTSSWWHYRTMHLGTLRLPDAGKKTLTARGTKTGGAVMNLKAVILTPAPEGAPWPLQPASDGSILLHSKDARVDGITLRYEPVPEKNTLGFWSNPVDRATWEFEAHQDGPFDIELLQGCGKGQGGSEVEVLIDGAKALAFAVEDTGGWQAFKPRVVGRVTLAAGTHTLTLAPVHKAKAAVMDVRQVRLVPP